MSTKESKIANKWIINVFKFGSEPSSTHWTQVNGVLRLWKLLVKSLRSLSQKPESNSDSIDTSKGLASSPWPTFTRFIVVFHSSSKSLYGSEFGDRFRFFMAEGVLFVEEVLVRRVEELLVAIVVVDVEVVVEDMFTSER